MAVVAHPEWCDDFVLVVEVGAAAASSARAKASSSAATARYKQDRIAPADLPVAPHHDGASVTVCLGLRPGCQHKTCDNRTSHAHTRGTPIDSHINTRTDSRTQ